jgi:hypothetical protein
VTTPTDQQRAAMILACSEGYVRPTSPTHQRRTNNRRLVETVKACQRAGWMTQGVGGQWVLTEAGHALVPSTPLRQYRRDIDGPDDEAVF